MAAAGGNGCGGGESMADAETPQGQGIALHPGHCIGEFSAIDRLPVSALVRCGTEAEVIPLSGPFLWEQLVSLFLCIGDGSGHGIGAALLMARTIGLIRSLAMTTPGPEVVLEQLNALLCEGNDTCLFAILFCGYLEPTRDILTSSNAGHLPPLLIQAGRCTELPLPLRDALRAFSGSSALEDDSTLLVLRLP